MRMHNSVRTRRTRRHGRLRRRTILRIAPTLQPPQRRPRRQRGWSAGRRSADTPHQRDATGALHRWRASSMKFLTSQIAFITQTGDQKRNLRLLLRFVVLLLLMMTVFSVLFHVLMVMEDQQHSWITGLYWTLTVMSTLGFGDITFRSDIGRIFSIVVMVSGVVFLLVVLPFTFIEFF